jgi:hypothetical protein
MSTVQRTQALDVRGRVRAWHMHCVATGMNLLAHCVRIGRQLRAGAEWLAAPSWQWYIVDPTGAERHAARRVDYQNRT